MSRIYRMSESQERLDRENRRRLWAGWTHGHTVRLIEWRQRAAGGIDFIPNAEALGFPAVLSVLCVEETAFIFAECEGVFELSRIKRVKLDGAEADWWGLKPVN